MKSRPELVARVRGLLERYGIAAIMVGYHIGPTHALVTGVAGIVRMPRFKFEAINLLSATIGIAGYAIIGAIPGTFIDADSPMAVFCDILRASGDDLADDRAAAAGVLGSIRAEYHAAFEIFFLRCPVS